ncbi:fumarylacetoacetate hydrolase family protein [Aquabacterium lacunae]|nr:fumarylacetoacetate hydrolase family protein [Aquabacterium lacunae]
MNHTPTDRVQRMALGLLQARQQGEPFTPPADCVDLNVDEAYAVQALVGEGMGWFAQGVPAWKAGGSPTVSAAPLPAVHPSPGRWQPVVARNTREWLIEAEVAFRLARAPQGPDLATDVVAAIGTVAVAIEAIDTRLGSGLSGSPSNWKLADQGVHGVLVIGPEQPAQPWLRWAPEAWGQLAWQIDVNGHTAQQAQGGLPAVEPLGALRWLAMHAAEHTGGLKAGDVVTTGAWGMVRARRGEVVDVRFGGLGQARLTLD